MPTPDDATAAGGPLYEQRQIDALRDQFEHAFRAGDRPNIEDYLARLDDSLHARALSELLQLEIALLQQAGQTIDSDDYRKRFPSQQVVVEVAIAEALADLPSIASTKDQSTSTKYKQSRTIGPYKLLQRIGHGGMGEVWMAEQEKPVRRRVAVKLIRSGMDSKEVVARFEAERQALAMMDHHNIAKVLDAGETDDGQPYFVMELVQGIPFHQYCDNNKLTLKERLELFIPICKAVQHAHQKGIIHRDLKPTNVLVTLYDGKPVPKVIDFGLAKALQHQVRLTDRTLFTEFNQVVGTVQYMSPEQAEMNALDVDTRSDIYSLGVMLFELLTGSTPIEKETIKKHAIFEVLRLITESDPPRPSIRLSDSGDAIQGISAQRKIESSKLQQLLRGDLDWIAMKALEKDRTRRYTTADALADDVRRFLSDEAVEARPPSFSYRLKKSLRKHRAAVLTLGLISFSLIAGITGTTWQWYQVRKANLLVTAERTRTEEALKDSERQLVRALAAERTARSESDIAKYRLLHINGADPYLRLSRALNAVRTQYPPLVPAVNSLYEAVQAAPNSSILPYNVDRISWSPNGELIAMSLAHDSQQILILTKLAHLIATIILPDERADTRYLYWNATSDRIVVDSNSFTSFVYTENGDLVATFEARDHGSTCWSHDGQFVAFTRGLGGEVGVPQPEPTIFVYTKDGMEFRQFDCPEFENASLSLNWSPSEHRLALSSSTKVYIFDVNDQDEAQGRQLGDANGSFIWSPDGSFIATYRSNEALRTWTSDGALLASISMGGQISSVKWKPDSSSLLIAAENRADLRIADRFESFPIRNPASLALYSAQGEMVHDYAKLGLHHSRVNAMLWSQDGRRVAVNGDNGLSVFDGAGNRLASIGNRDNFVSDFEWSYDGQLLAILDSNHDLHVWDKNLEREDMVEGLTATHLTSYRIIGKHGNLAWHPSEYLLAASGVDDDVRITRFPRERTLFTLLGHHDPVLDVDWSHDGQLIASSAYDINHSTISTPAGPIPKRDVIIWNGNGEPIANVSKRGGKYCWNPKKSVVAVINSEESMLFDSGGEEILSLQGGKSAFWNHKGDILTIQQLRGDPERYSEPGYCQRLLFIRVSGRSAVEVGRFESEILQVAGWNSGDSLLACYTKESGLVLLTEEEGVVLEKRGLLASGNTRIRNLSWTPDGDALAISASPNRYAYDSGKSEADPPEVIGVASDGSVIFRVTREQFVSWSPDGNLFLAAKPRQAEGLFFESRPTRLGAIVLRDRKGQIVSELEGTNTYFTDAVAWDPRRKVFATGGSDGVVRVWDRRGKLISTSVKEDSSVIGLSWDHDGRLLASGTEQGVFRILNRRARRILDLQPLERPSFPLRREVTGFRTQIGEAYAPSVLIRWSPDSRQLITRAYKEVPHVWLADLHEIYEVAVDRLRTERARKLHEDGNHYWDPLDAGRWKAWIASEE